MGFILVLILTTLSLAGSAAFFSVCGLAKIFAGSFWPVVIMASSLEAGKLVTASYLYRYWDHISVLMRAYMFAAIVVLMGITSAGIFGFLSAAYQQDIVGTKINKQQIEMLTTQTNQAETLKQERLARKKQIDKDIASLPHDYVTGRQRLMKSYGPELEQLRKDIAEYTARIQTNTQKIAELRAATLQQESHVGPIIFIAKVFDKDVDDTTKWLILIIIFAFDPLAVTLTVGANIALVDRQRSKKKNEPKLVKAYEEVMGIEKSEENEPEPKITSVDQLLDQPKEAVTADQIKEALDEFEHRELSETELAQKEMLEEMLRRKAVTQRLRTPISQS